jgi:hypothetical protein
MYPKLIGILEYEYPKGLDENRPRLRKKKEGIRLFSLVSSGGSHFVELSEETVKVINGEERWMRGALGPRLVRKAHLQYRCLQAPHVKQGFRMLALEWKAQVVGEESPAATRGVFGGLSGNAIKLPSERLSAKAHPYIHALPDPVSAARIDFPRPKIIAQSKAEAPEQRSILSSTAKNSESPVRFLKTKYGEVYNPRTHKPCSRDNGRIESISCFALICNSNPLTRYASCRRHQ